MICYQQKNVVKPGYSVFIRQTTSAGVVWLLTTLSHSLYIVYESNWIRKLSNWIRELCNTPHAFEELSNWIRELSNWAE